MRQNSTHHTETVRAPYRPVPFILAFLTILLPLLMALTWFDVTYAEPWLLDNPIDWRHNPTWENLDNRHYRFYQFARSGVLMLIPFLLLRRVSLSGKFQWLGTEPPPLLREPWNSKVDIGRWFLAMFFGSLMLFILGNYLLIPLLLSWLTSDPFYRIVRYIDLGWELLSFIVTFHAVCRLSLKMPWFWKIPETNDP